MARLFDINTTTHDPSSIICHDGGKGGQFKSGGAIQAKVHGKIKTPAVRSKKARSGDGVGQKWRLCRGRSRTATPSVAHRGSTTTGG